jgi:hypothetical protein
VQHVLQQLMTAPLDSNTISFGKMAEHTSFFRQVVLRD